MRERKHLQPEDVVFLVDTREQRPLDFSAVENRSLFKIAPATLVTGDYSVRGLEQEIAVERKSLEDLLMCVGRERERFERELRRMQSYEARLVVVEATWQQLGVGGWRSQITPRQVQGSIMRWQTWRIPFHFAHSREDASRFVANFMWLHTKSCYDKLRAFHDNLRLAGGDADARSVGTEEGTSGAD